VLVVKTAPREQSQFQLWNFHMPPMRVLVIEDFAPFFQVVRSTLAERTDVEVIGEVGDGLEGVQKAELLEPDLVLLDIGLPMLNGIEAARQIRKLAPESKIIFLSQESDCEVVQEALNAGAWGYVVKTRTATDLLAAVDAVLEDRQFVSFGLSIQNLNCRMPRPSAATLPTTGLLSCPKPPRPPPLCPTRVRSTPFQGR
jgi:DNA-binding NarL/FixJ family response regulator